MKNGYKECPFCKNEIKNDAIKCMYCKEMLNDDASYEVFHDNKRNVSRLNFKTILLGVIIGIIFFVIVSHVLFRDKSNNVLISDDSNDSDNDLVLDKNLESDYNNVLNLRDSMDTYYDSIINSSGKTDSEDLINYLDSTKNVFSDPKFQNLLDEMNDTVSTYINKVNLIGDLYISETYELKDLSKLNHIVSNWKEYKALSDKYLLDVSRIVDDTVYVLGKSGFTDDYSIRQALDNVTKLVHGIDDWADINLEFFSFVISIQNDFYIGDDGAILFYEKGYSNNKFLELWVEWEKQSEIFEDLYTNYNNFMVDYATQAKMK